MGLLPSTHMGTPPDVLKLVHYVAHTSIGKRVVALRLKGLATSAFSPHCWAELNRFFLKKSFGGHMPPVLDFCWCLLWVPKPGVGSLILWQRCIWCAFPEIHLWCNTCWSLDDQHGSQLLFPISVFQQRQDAGLNRLCRFFQHRTVWRDWGVVLRQSGPQFQGHNDITTGSPDLFLVKIAVVWCELVLIPVVGVSSYHDLINTHERPTRPLPLCVTWSTKPDPGNWPFGHCHGPL